MAQTGPSPTSANRIAGNLRSVPVDTALEALLRRDRVAVVAALLAAIALSWACLRAGAGMATMEPAVRTPGHAVVMFVLWWIMAVAMMLPSAAPMILLFAAVHRKQRDDGHPYVATSMFVLGYLAAWAGFSLIAVVLQWGLERVAVPSPTPVATNAVLAGFVLLAAGVYQLTPIKHACLRTCRSPQAFLGTHWRRGARGALRMGLLHGASCVGCCWCLMGLMFVGGSMNLYWTSGIALFVLFEKTLKAGHRLGYASGVALLVWGAAVLAGA